MLLGGKLQLLTNESACMYLNIHVKLRRFLIICVCLRFLVWKSCLTFYETKGNNSMKIIRAARPDDMLMSII
jgi:hypothetical protein